MVYVVRYSGALLVALLFLQGCFLAPAIQDFRSTGLTESGRKEALGEELRDFHQALFWGSVGQALSHASPDSVAQLRKDLRELKKEGRIVDTKVEFVDFTDNSRSAEVEVTVRFHNYATNIVSPYTSMEKWAFTLSGGWKVVSMQKQSDEAAG